MKNVKRRPRMRGAQSIVNPAGTKIASAVERSLGIPKRLRGNTIFHGGELTAAATERRRARFQRKFGATPWLE